MEKAFGLKFFIVKTIVLGGLFDEDRNGASNHHTPFFFPWSFFFFIIIHGVVVWTISHQVLLFFFCIYILVHSTRGWKQTEKKKDTTSQNKLRAVSHWW